MIKKVMQNAVETNTAFKQRVEQLAEEMKSKGGHKIDKIFYDGYESCYNIEYDNTPTIDLNILKVEEDYTSYYDKIRQVLYDNNDDLKYLPHCKLIRTLHTTFEWNVDNIRYANQINFFSSDVNVFQDDINILSFFKELENYIDEGLGQMYGVNQLKQNLPKSNGKISLYYMGKDFFNIIKDSNNNLRIIVKMGVCLK